MNYADPVMPSHLRADTGRAHPSGPSIRGGRSALYGLAFVVLGGCGASEATAVDHPSAPVAESAASAAASAAAQCTVVVECRSLLAATEHYEETRAGSSRVAACRAAGDAVRTEHPCELFSVDGVSVGWLRSAAVDPPPPGSLEREVACEVEVAHATSDETMGHAEGPSDEEAVSAASRAACTAMGESACALGDGFLSSVRSRRSSMHLADGVMASNTEVEVALWRVTVAQGRGTSVSSSAEACAAAYQLACGDEGCADRDRVVSVDGITVTP